MSEANRDSTTWEEEAEGVITDIKDLTKKALVSKILVSNKQKIFINITTLEDKDFCVEITSAGFRVAGLKHDDMENSSEEFYETPYALLSTISPSYHNQFANSLINKLKILRDQTNE